MSRHLSTRRLPGRLRARISTDLIVVLVLFAGLVAFSAYTTARKAEQEQAPAYSTHATAPNGAAALYLWLEELGYRVQRIENGPFKIAERAELLFVIAPPQPFNAIEIRFLRDWVEEPGHTLVLATAGLRGLGLAQEFGIETMPAVENGQVLTPTVPLLTSPPPGPVEAGARRGLRPERDDFVAHLQAGETPVLISFRQGEGRVFVTNAAAPLTNAGLRDLGSARLVHNLLAGLDDGALVQFDEVHHGYIAAEQEHTVLAWLRRSPWGWALLYGAVVILGWVVLRGQRFGRPVPRPEQVARRPQGEYVVSMAGLFRRAGRRTFVMRHHHDRLKRELARPWRINPDLPDDAFVAELARCRDDLDETALGDLLARLSGERVGESELVRLVGEVEKWVGPYGTS